ncbi:MAG: zinc ribbon domain-containing protein [Christensenellaceae bacterium]|nr:zinc ribbon domain-containing protein [Christensenellaceae bacterium]
MFCTQCGQKLADGSRFCTACGKPTALAAVPAAQRASVAESAPIYEMPAEPAAPVTESAPEVISYAPAAEAEAPVAEPAKEAVSYAPPAEEAPAAEAEAAAAEPAPEVFSYAPVAPAAPAAAPAAPAAPKAAAPAAPAAPKAAAPAHASLKAKRQDRFVLKLIAAILGLLSLLLLAAQPFVFNMAFPFFDELLYGINDEAFIALICIGGWIGIILLLLLLGTILSFAGKKVPGLFLPAFIMLLPIAGFVLLLCIEEFIFLLGLPTLIGTLFTLVATVLGYCAKPSYKRYPAQNAK